MATALPASLTGRLVATVVTLVALLSVLTAAATTVAIHGYLTGQLDAEVQQANERAIGALRRGLPPGTTAGEDSHPEDGEERGEEPEVEYAYGQSVGTLTAYLSPGLSRGSVITPTGDRPPLTPAVLGSLDGVRADGRVHDLELSGLGDYRLVARDLGDVTVVTGLPDDEVDNTVGSLVGWETLFTILGVLTAGGVGLFLVRRQLQPLREVSETAHRVARLPLETGEIGLTARVPDRLTEERSEVGQVGAALNTLLGRVESALDARHRSEQQVRQFVADASHELRTPLATIQGYAELARRGRAPDPEQLRRTLGKVELEAIRMSALVEDLLLLARLDAGRPLRLEEVDLTKLVLEAVGDARVVAPDHRWILDLDAEPVIVAGDDQRLHQVITNLLNNARRHTPAGSTVRVAAHVESGGDVRVTVADDGPGIPVEVQDTVFERFTRGDASRARDSGGVGLGLSLARAIVAAHGGDLVLQSRPGWTCFTLTIPARSAGVPPAP